MKAEILSIGTELLLGEILNTNSKFLAKELAILGIDVFYQTVVGDNPKRIKSALEIAFTRADIVITTGGLGPTQDDLTKNVVADFFNLNLTLNKTALENIKAYFNNKYDSKKSENLNLSDSNLKQAYFPKNSQILKNNNGTASGCLIKHPDKTIIMLPGPPNEVIPMFNSYVKPILTKFQTKFLINKSINLVGIGESEAADKINNIILNSTNPTVAPYANNNEVRFRITASGKTKEDALKTLNPTLNKLYSIFKPYIYSEDDKTLAEIVGDLLFKHNLSLSFADFFTDGLLSYSLANIPKISNLFFGGINSTYNKNKINNTLNISNNKFNNVDNIDNILINILNISKKILNKYEIISAKISEEIAKKVSSKFNSNIGLCIIGFNNLIYISIHLKNSLKNNNIITKKIILSGNDEKIKSKAVTETLNQLRLLLLNYKGD